MNEEIRQASAEQQNDNREQTATEAADKELIVSSRSETDSNMPQADSNLDHSGHTGVLATPSAHFQFFTSSQIPQSEELTAFLKKSMSENPFNKYCIDCKKNRTTHFLVWLGIFTCESCSLAHLNLPRGAQSKSYVKNVFNEQWDDYQLRSLQIGGNKALFELLKEFSL